MAPRSSWKGFLNLSLVSVPVKAYSATNSGGSVRLNQLHGNCNSRINYKNVCPLCGEVPRSEIVKGYEYAKDQYVIIDLDELQKLRADDESKAIRIDAFIHPEVIDPVYFSDTHYYLLPDGAAGQKPFALLTEAMEKKNLSCVAKVVLHNKEQLVLVRPVDGLLRMTVLKYVTQVKSPDSFRDELTESKLSPEEFKLADTLLSESTAPDFNLADYKDTYTERLTQLIEAKVAGQELVAPPSVEVPPVINLMEALKASVAAVQGTPPKTVAQSRQKGAKSAPMKKVASAKKSTTAGKKKTSKANKALTEALAKPRKKSAPRKKKTG